MTEDYALLEAWRGGDGAAGSELFERYYDRLYGFLRNTVPDALDDVVQKTMLACVEGRDRITGEFSAYMFGAARRQVYREYDRRQREGQRLDYGVSSVHDLAPSPSSILAARDRDAVLGEAMRRTPLDYQVALYLRYWGGLRGPQLATALDIPEGTVRSRLRRGIERMRKTIEEIEADPERAREARATVDDWERTLDRETDEPTED